MVIVLYQFPGGDGLTSVSPPCVRVEMALKRVGADYRSVYLKSFREARKFSATGRLPLLEIDGERIPDSIQILDELERRFPDAGLSPTDPVARMRDRLCEHFINDHVYYLGYYMRWIWDEGRERLLGAMLKNAPFMLRALAPPVMRRETAKRARAVGIGGKTIEQIRRSYERAFDLVETGLAGGPFLEGRDTPGRGDLAVAATLGQAGYRDTMPEMEQRVRERTALLQHARSVFEACSMELPRWLQRG